MDGFGLRRILCCDFCEGEISACGKCSCEEDVCVSHIETHKHFYNLQLQQIIKHCKSSGVPSPSQFPSDVSFEVRIEGKHKRIYSVHSMGPRNLVQIKLDTQWFSDYQKENGQQCQTNTLGENPTAISQDGNPRQHSAEREKNNGQLYSNETEKTLISEICYTLPVRVTFHIANYTTLQIISPRLDWCRLLQDLDSSKADLTWHFYLQKAPRVDMQVVLNDKDKELITGNSKDGEETRCVDNGPANLVLPQPSQQCFNEGDAWCCICHSSILEMGEWKQLLQLPCGHGYHSECIAKWLGANNTCPLCRYQLPSCS
ncbi:hypothetical protein SUGI_0643440 [Cryptomeria japonica]|nr:hypothetical protein SUGI_0643440 [Cryptomeria japonica]